MEIKPPFVTTPVETVKQLIQLLKDHKNNKIVDLGSGDGRIVVEIAKKGFSVDGFETKPELVKRSRERIAELKLEQIAHILEKDYWDENLSSYSVVYIYGIPQIMGRLERKLENELVSGSLVISNVYRLPQWKIKKQIDSLYIYIIP
ncbi:MAG: methyltransferase domain-containing protein [Patescibacteria group bacterium]|nr:methyltransferase domain-containing protein [Patescibacteria group bacterium]